jgi:hypothetical protein
MIWRYKWLILNNMVKLFYTAVVYFMDLICVHWRCNIFLHMHPIKSRHVSICWDILGINQVCKNILHCWCITINLVEIYVPIEIITFIPKYKTLLIIFNNKITFRLYSSPPPASLSSSPTNLRCRFVAAAYSFVVVAVMPMSSSLQFHRRCSVFSLSLTPKTMPNPQKTTSG